MFLKIIHMKEMAFEFYFAPFCFFLHIPPPGVMSRKFASRIFSKYLGVMGASINGL